MARPAQRWTQETRIHKGHTQLDQDIYKVQRVCEILFIYFCAFIGFIFDRDSEEMTEGRVREREEVMLQRATGRT